VFSYQRQCTEHVKKNSRLRVRLIDTKTVDSSTVFKLTSFRNQHFFIVAKYVIAVNSQEVAKTYYKNLARALESHVEDGQTASEVAYIQSFLTSNDTILDVGCGYGRIAKELAKTYEVRGCDLSEEMIALANDERFIVANMLSLPYADNQFSVSLCLWSTFNSLLTRQEQLQGLAELVRVSSRVVFIDLPDGDDREHFMDVKRKGEGPDGHIVRGYFRGPKNAIYVHTSATMRSLCDELGLACTIKRELFGGRRRLLVRFEKVRP